jgi:hypothetical protein
VTSQLVITATVRPATTTAMLRSPFWYAFWLPIAGVSLWSAQGRRRRRAVWLGTGLLIVLLGVLGACGGSKSAPPTGGTPAGTYDITVSSTSGSFTEPPSTTPLKIRLTVE